MKTDKSISYSNIVEMFTYGCIILFVGCFLHDLFRSMIWLCLSLVATGGIIGIVALIVILVKYFDIESKSK